MDFIKKAVSGGGGDNNKSGENSQQNESSQSGGGGGLFGGMGDKFNSAAGGGKESEKNEDLLDKGMCVFLPTLYLSQDFSFLSLRPPGPIPSHPFPSQFALYFPRNQYPSLYSD